MRLTTVLRNEIISNALKHAYSDEQEAIRLARVSLGADIYDKFVTPEQEALAHKLGREFVHFSSSFHIDMEGYGRRQPVILAKERPLTGAMLYGNESLDDLALMARHDKLVERQNTLANNLATLRSHVSGVVSAYSTLKALKEAWPEGVCFLPEIKETTRLPSVIPAKVTAALVRAGAFKEASAAA